MKKKTEKSAVLQLLDLVWTNTNRGTKHSYERLNHAMRDALQLAIGSGFKFNVDDMSAIFNNYRSGYWIGSSDEWIYSLACEVENISACESFENAKNRKPFIIRNMRSRPCHGFTHLSTINRIKSRAYCGAWFKWGEDEVNITSFAKDQSYFTACSRTQIDNISIVKSRCKISHDDLKAAYKSKKLTHA